jgi:beta-phosphoglucomutase
MRAAVFDLDGTLVDNMPIHAEAFAIFATRHGLRPLTVEDRQRLDGRRNSEILPELFGRPLTAEELDTYADEKESLYRSLSTGRLAPVRGLERLLDRLESLGVPSAIATSAPAPNVTHTLAELGLAARLTTIVRSDLVGRGKPFPDVFLEAARQLGVPASGCVAFEDAPIGVAAAAAAGMTVVALTTSFTPDVFAAQPVPPTHVVGDFEEFLGRRALGFGLGRNTAGPG